MRASAWLATILAGTLVPAAAAASGSAGADPFAFLFLDADARSIGMGGAHTALSDDANALLYNPGGLGLEPDYAATFMHNQYFAGITQEYASFAAPQGWGVQLNYLNFGSVKQTTLSNPDGSGLGATGLSDAAVSVGYGHELLSGLSLGAAAKYLREDVAGVVGQSPAFDVGALFAPPRLEGLRLGAAVQNIGPAVKFQGAGEPLPVNARGGVAYSFPLAGQKTTLSIDAAKERAQSPVFGAGAELVIAGVMPVRVGFNGRNQSGPGVSAGVGWIYKSLALDFAFVPFGDLGAASFISATIHWGSPLDRERREEPRRWR